MHGSIRWQVDEIFHKSGINQIGVSKHIAKEGVRQELKSSGQQTNWHTIGKEMGIHSYGTADTYREIWRMLGNYAKAEFKVRDMEKLTGEHARAFLESKLAGGLAHKTLLLYSASIEKLEVALNGYAAQKETGRVFSFANDIGAVRTAANEKLERFDESRAYADPSSLAAAVGEGRYNLITAIQRESGCRVKETNYMHKDQLRGLHRDAHTGQVKGWIEVKGKGGKVRQISVSPSTYNRLKTVLACGKRLVFKPDGYRYELKKAAEKTDQRYEGSHGLRWSWAQERFQELQRHGMSYEKAMFQVSNEMGHERGDITGHYLK